MHLRSIALSTVRGSKGQEFGRAPLVIVNDQGGFVAPSVPEGSFDGSYNEAQPGTTDASGTANLTTDAETRKPAFQFCGNTITGTSLTYALGSDVVSCTSHPKSEGRRAPW